MRYLVYRTHLIHSISCICLYALCIYTQMSAIQLFSLISTISRSVIRKRQLNQIESIETYNYARQAIFQSRIASSYFKTICVSIMHSYYLNKCSLHMLHSYTPRLKILVIRSNILFVLYVHCILWKSSFTQLVQSLYTRLDFCTTVWDW